MASHVKHSAPASIRDHFNFIFSNQRWLPEKSQKSQLAQEIKGLLPAPPEMVPTNRKQSMIVFDHGLLQKSVDQKT